MHIYILGFSILICQKIVIETNCIETHKVILNEHMYVYNIVEAQNKSAQKNANLICNMQIVLKKNIYKYIPGIYMKEQKLLYAWKIFFIVPPFTKS